MVVAIDVAADNEPLVRVTVKNLGDTPRTFSHQGDTRTVHVGHTRELLLPLSQAERLQRFALASDLKVVRFRVTMPKASQL